MNFFKRLFGARKQQLAHEQQPAREPQLGGIAGGMQETIQKHMDILRYLCTCGKFDRDKMANYISMAEKTGMQWEPQEKHQMLNATAFFMPKRQSDGTVIDGFEQLRIEFIEAAAGAVSQGIKVIKQLFPEPATASFLKRVVDEMNELIRQFT